MARKLIGTVTSNKTDKTFTIKVDRRVAHPIYRKQYTVSKKYHVHDPKNEVLTGDRVEVEEVKPISKTKHWQLVRIIERPESLEEGSR